MKEKISLLNKISAKSLRITWLVYHLGIAFAFLLVFFLGSQKIKIDSDLFNMIPKSLSMESVKKADEKMTAITGQNVFILVSNPTFSEAKSIAEKVYDKLLETEFFESVTLYNDVNSLSETTDFLFEYRWNMLDDNAINEINEDEYSFAMEALSTAYGGFTMLPLDNLEKDPFMLTEHNLQVYLNSLQKSGTAMTLTDGVLASQKNGRWYVMIRGVLNKKGSTLASKNNGITAIYDICGDFTSDGENSTSDVRNFTSGEQNSTMNQTRFIFSGTPFHSHKSSTSASKEISLIATISMLIVIFMLIFVFRSSNPIKPLLFSILSILISILVAFLSTLVVFKKMHIITLVFGTSLIGSCIDYSLHFFVHWAGNSELKSGEEIRKHIMSGLTMAIISTGICFTILLFAPFTLLKQMSLFCLTGLISSYLTTISIFPTIKLPQGERKLKILPTFARNIKKIQNKIVGRVVISLIFVFVIVCLCLFRKNIRIENNILSLYKMQGQILENEIEAAQIIQYSPSGWYIIQGDDEQTLLENEEKFRRSFEDFTQGQLGYISTSLFVPSIQRQKQSRNACEKLLQIAEPQLEAFGFDGNEAEILKNEFYSTTENFISFENENVPEFISSAVSSAWLGEINGKYYSVLLPNKVDNYETFKNLAENNDNVYFISKSADVSRDLDKLTIMVLKFFIIAYILMFIMLKFFYTWKQALKIISVPLLIILMTTGIYAMQKINLEFFSVTGIILVFGLGLDYIIYVMENEKSRTRHNKCETSFLEPFATMLSFVTTIISFGALALSSFQPVHLIGLAITIGLTTAYICSLFYGRSDTICD